MVVFMCVLFLRCVLTVGKRKRTDESKEAEMSNFVAYAREHIHSQEVGEEGFSIDPSERSVEHRANKVVRREILIASPAANDEDDWEGNRSLEIGINEVEPVLTPTEHFDLQPIDIILHVFSFLVTAKDLQSMAQVSKKWKELTSRRSLYRLLPSVTPEGSVNWINFKNLGIKNKGTEGTCIKCCQRSTGKILAIKKARVFPKVNLFATMNICVMECPDNSLLCFVRTITGGRGTVLHAQRASCSEGYQARSHCVPRTHQSCERRASCVFSLRGQDVT